MTAHNLFLRSYKKSISTFICKKHSNRKGAFFGHPKNAGKSIATARALFSGIQKMLISSYFSTKTYVVGTH